jgi:hypothetical protein
MLLSILVQYSVRKSLFYFMLNAAIFLLQNEIRTNDGKGMTCLVTSGAATD